jgi:hypothetical protein
MNEIEQRMELTPLNLESAGNPLTTLMRERKREAKIIAMSALGAAVLLVAPSRPAFASELASPVESPEQHGGGWHHEGHGDGQNRGDHPGSGRRHGGHDGQRHGGYSHEESRERIERRARYWQSVREREIRQEEIRQRQGARDRQIREREIRQEEIRQHQAALDRQIRQEEIDRYNREHRDRRPANHR